MNKAVGLSPIIIILSMMLGYQYMNVLGLVLAIPIATVVAIFVHDYTARVK
jgi:predicted PurR-regulated permease PerM